MKDYEAYNQPKTEQTFTDRLSTFTRWLSRRPMESWGFFIAGLIIARILF